MTDTLPAHTIAALTSICDALADVLATLPPPVDRRLAEAAWQLAVAVQFLQEDASRS